MKICRICKISQSDKEFRYGENRCRSCRNEYHRKWRSKNRIEANKLSREWYQNNKEREQTKHKEYNRKIKIETFAHYGKVCQCCGESDLDFLSLDHINGGGCKHLKSLGLGGGRSIYLYLKRNNYPEGYQVLCYNCNCGKRINNGICPHKKEIGRVR